MATEPTTTAEGAVQRAFQPGTTPPNGAGEPSVEEAFVLTPPLTATLAPATTGDAGLDADILREMYRAFVLARSLDQRIWQLNRTGQAPFVVSGQGHEAAQIGAAFALDRERDVLVPYYRDLAFCLVWGLTPYDLLLSVFARADDPTSGGRQMPGHYSSAAHRIISGSSVVATQLPIATGVAYAAKLRQTGQVTVVCFGEGASSEGDFHEACNFAGIHRLPIIFFCENNNYAISVPMERQMAIAHVADRAIAYGFPGVVVDGDDPLAVFHVVREAAEQARRGDGPTLIEAKVYRFTPHSSDDDDRSYRDQAEVVARRARDALGRFETRLRDLGIIDEVTITTTRRAIEREINEATEAAEAAPLPDPATYDRHVYAER
jgi:2-oxoisovalerate dehydrogenase E1 component alpha subunit